MSGGLPAENAELIERLEKLGRDIDNGYVENGHFDGDAAHDGALALRACEAEKRRAAENLRLRDEFIVAQGLWMAFIETLPSPNALRATTNQGDQP